MKITFVDFRGDCPNRPAPQEPPIPYLQHNCILIQRWLHTQSFIICWTDGVICHSDGQGGEQNKGAIGGRNNTKGAKMLDHWVNFTSLLSWLVSFLQMIIYYDNRLRLLLKLFIFEILLWIVDRQRARLQCGLFQGTGAVVKMTQLRLRSSSSHEHDSSSGAFDFHECGAGFRSFSHIYILIGSMFLNFTGKWVKSSTQN